jgi:choline kinase
LAKVEGGDYTAILLAAGVGQRLSDHGGPKVLLEFGGQSLLQRTMTTLFRHGVRRLTITVGFEESALRSAAVNAVAQGGLRGLQVGFVTNPDYQDGSLLSLHAQGMILTAGEPVLVMDGDVLYDPSILGRLLGGQSEGVLLVDQEIEPGDEPVKICFDDQDRIVDFRKRPTEAYRWFGESVGFFKFSGAMAQDLFDRCDWYVRNGLVKTEYEEAIRDLIMTEPHRFEAVDVSDLAWTEIDFPEDVVRARDVVLPQMALSSANLDVFEP